MYVIAFNQISVSIALDGHSVSVYSTIMIPDIDLLVEVRQATTSVALCVAIGYTDRLKVGMKAVLFSTSPTLQFYPKSCGRIMDSNLKIIAGKPLKEQESETLNVRGSGINLQYVANTQKVTETGIKAIDFFCPYPEGGTIGIMGGAGTGKTILTMEIIHNMRRKDTMTIIAGVGERIREGIELFKEFHDTGLISTDDPDSSNIYIIFGTMDQPPALRERTAFAAVALAEFIRDKYNKSVLIIKDNIYRFLQAGSEVSSSLKEMPGEGGYQPTLYSAIGNLQERMNSSNRARNRASLTSVQAIYVPQDDITDPTAIATSKYMDGVVVLDRNIASRNIYPCIDPMRTFSGMIVPKIIGQKHYVVINKIRYILNEHCRLRKVAELLGESQLEGDNKTMYHRGKLVYSFISQPLFTSSKFSNTDGQYVKTSDTVRGFEMIANGELDHIDPENIYMIGKIK